MATALFRDANKDYGYAEWVAAASQRCGDSGLDLGDTCVISVLASMTGAGASCVETRAASSLEFRARLCDAEQPSRIRTEAT